MAFLNQQVRSILSLSKAARAFGRGRDVPDFRPSGANEVREAARAVIDMKNRLTSFAEQRTAMLNGVSHDLRTPLTRMKLQLAMLNSNTEIDELNSDVAAMEGMIEGYLNFARGEGTEERQSVDAGILLEEVVHDAQRNGNDVSLDIRDTVELPLARAAMRRCLSVIDASQRLSGSQRLSRFLPGRRRFQ